MLGRKTMEQVNAKISSIIGADMVVEGTIKGTDAIRIEGTLMGDVCSEGTLVISSTGKVVGNVKGSNIMVAGTIEGDLYSGGRTEVAATGRIIGNIRTKSLIIDENAVFQGQCMMNVEGAAAQRENEVAEAEMESAGNDSAENRIEENLAEDTETDQ